jgi:hypothetical protein
MGGIGSGSRGYSRARYENLCPIDLAKIERNKPAPGLWRQSSWVFGAATRTTDITAWSPIENFGFRLQHIAFNPDGTTSKAEVSVGYTVTRQSAAHPIEQLALSGRRWFCCPGCQRACRIVYGKAGFRCRLCIRNGIYASQAESSRWRSVQRAQRMRTRLGGSADLSKPFPRKPRTMHWAKYRKLTARYQHAFNRISFR